MYAIAAVAATQVYSKPTESWVSWLFRNGCRLWMLLRECRWHSKIIGVSSYSWGCSHAVRAVAEEGWRSVERQQSQQHHESFAQPPDPNLSPVNAKFTWFRGFDPDVPVTLG